MRPDFRTTAIRADLALSRYRWLSRAHAGTARPRKESNRRARRLWRQLGRIGPRRPADKESDADPRKAAERTFDGGAIETVDDEDQARAAVTVRPGGQVEGRMDEMLHAVHHHRRRCGRRR